VLLGYVGKEGPGWDLERWVHALDVRFAVWNAETGAPVSLSERLFPHVYADWPGLGLAANGTVAIAYRPWRSEEAVEVFDLPEVPRGRAR